MNIAILGFGARGHVFADYILKNDKAKLTHVCDCLQLELQNAVNDYGVLLENCYLTAADFFKQGKVADALIIATKDSDHIFHVREALKLGYDVLLEKPAATNIADCLEIKNLAHLYNRKVMICHVLRYTVFYQKIKELIDSKELGDVVAINQIENIGYWHFAHSYVRGLWKNSNTSSPMILAKSCHDIDIFCYLLGKKCLSLSSFGALTFFKKENAPKGAADYCYKCQLQSQCPYDCFTIYKNRVCSIMGGNSVVNGNNYSLDELLVNENSPYARCVFKSSNNVCDHQMVNMLFENDITCNLSVIAFSEKCFRQTKIFLTNGEIYGNLEDKKLYVNKFGKEVEIIDLTKFTTDFDCHEGGDGKLLDDFIAYCLGSESMALTKIDDSIASHIYALKAEESRLNGGKVIKF